MFCCDSNFAWMPANLLTQPFVRLPVILMSYILTIIEQWLFALTGLDAVASLSGSAPNVEAFRTKLSQLHINVEE